MTEETDDVDLPSFARPISVTRGATRRNDAGARATGPAVLSPFGGVLTVGVAAGDAPRLDLSYLTLRDAVASSLRTPDRAPSRESVARDDEADPDGDADERERRVRDVVYGDADGDAAGPSPVHRPPPGRPDRPVERRSPEASAPGERLRSVAVTERSAGEASGAESEAPTTVVDRSAREPGVSRPDDGPDSGPATTGSGADAGADRPAATEPTTDPTAGPPERGGAASGTERGSGGPLDGAGGPPGGAPAVGRESPDDAVQRANAGSPVGSGDPRDGVRMVLLDRPRPAPGAGAGRSGPASGATPGGEPTSHRPEGPSRTGTEAATGAEAGRGSDRGGDGATSPGAGDPSRELESALFGGEGADGRLADRLYREFRRKMRIERDRRGR